MHEDLEQHGKVASKYSLDIKYLLYDHRNAA